MPCRRSAAHSSWEYEHGTKSRITRAVGMHLTWLTGPSLEDVRIFPVRMGGTALRVRSLVFPFFPAPGTQGVCSCEVSRGFWCRWLVGVKWNLSHFGNNTGKE